MQAILKKIKKGLCEFLGRSGRSIIIDRPGKSACAIESAGHQESVATIQINFYVSWDGDVADALNSHFQFVNASIK